MNFTSSHSRLAVALYALFLIIVMIAAKPVFANPGNDNTYIQTQSSCNEFSDVSATHLNNTDTIDAYGGNSTSGNWSWQMQVYTIPTTYGPNYQWAVLVHDNEISDYALQYLYTSTYGTYDWIDQIAPNGDYYPGDNSIEGNIVTVIFPAFGDSDNTHLVTAVYYQVFVNGYLEDTEFRDIPSDDSHVPGGYDAQQAPSAYQNTLVGVPGSSEVAFTSGSGWFTTYGSNQRTTGCSTSLATAEDSNMGYSQYLDCVSGGGPCAESYTPSDSDPTVTVNSVNQYGTTITGYYIYISQSGSGVADGYTPYTYYDLALGDTYQVQADSYGSCTFAHWANLDTRNPKTWYAGGDPTFTAVYDCT